jgi:hypothetical protein
MMAKKGILFAFLLSIIMPMILAYLFLTLLTPIHWTQMTGGVLQDIAILSFSSLAFGYNVPIFGFGYVIPLFIWLITGLFVGLFSKSVKRGILITLLGLCIQILLFMICTATNPTFIPAFLLTTENADLLGGVSLNFLVTLGLFLCWWAFLLPGSVLGGIMGGLVSRSTISD